MLRHQGPRAKGRWPWAGHCSSGGACALSAHSLLAGGPLVQFVGQLMGHLRSEVRSFPAGLDIEGVALADEGYLPPDFVVHGDLVGSVAVDESAHCPRLLLQCFLERRSAPGGSRHVCRTEQPTPLDSAMA